MKQHAPAAAQQETLSALLDNEATPLEARRLLRDMSDDDAARLARWQLARDVLQRHAVAPVPADFSRRVMQALENEAPSRSWWLPLARVAVAASVALATVVGWQYWDTGSETTPAVASANQRPLLIGERELVSGSLQGQARPATLVREDERERLDDMLVRHSDFAARHGSQAVTPYARFISLEARKEQQ